MHMASVTNTYLIPSCCCKYLSCRCCAMWMLNILVYKRTQFSRNSIIYTGTLIRPFLSFAHTNKTFAHEQTYIWIVTITLVFSQIYNPLKYKASCFLSTATPFPSSVSIIQVTEPLFFISWEELLCIFILSLRTLGIRNANKFEL